MTFPSPRSSRAFFFSAMNLKPVKVSKHCTPLTSATFRAISVVTMVLRATAFSGRVPARLRALMT